MTGEKAYLRVSSTITAEAAGNVTSSRTTPTMENMNMTDVAQTSNEWADDWARCDDVYKGMRCQRPKEHEVPHVHVDTGWHFRWHFDNLISYGSSSRVPS